ncbi:MAG: alpha amylase C-terminal domain-containing protein, partial [Fusobacterium sp.]
NHLYKEQKSLWELDCSMDGFKWIDADNSDQGIVSYVRKSKDPKDYLVIVCNFTPVKYENFILGIPRITDYKEIFNSDRDIYGGSNILNRGIIEPRTQGIKDMPYSVKVDIPPLSTIVLKPIWADEGC